MNGREKIEISDSKIKIIDKKKYNLIMYKNDRIIKKLYKSVDMITQQGGDILEIGFGLHISSDYIQSKTNITSHTIIEIHPLIYESAIQWSNKKRNVEILLGDWIDLIPLQNKKFDGILFDTFLDENIPHFLEKIKANCKKGTLICFMKHPFDARLNAINSTDDNYEIKYTIFNGINFDKEHNSYKLI